MIATIDFETTGFKAGEDEVLQVSIKDSWEDAQAVHGITPLMVANELPFERYVPTVLGILSKADKVIAYNAAFEDSYLKAYGIEVDPGKWIDPMIMFAEIYGEWNERRGSYKWQSLTKCATYYSYEFEAHDSLEDVKATLYCYKKNGRGRRKEKREMLIGGKEYKTGQRIKIINAKSILHYKYGITGDCNKDMTGITGVITAESTFDEYARANLRVDEPHSEHYRNGMTRLFCDDEIELLEE